MIGLQEWSRRKKLRDLGCPILHRGAYLGSRNHIAPDVAATSRKRFFSAVFADMEAASSSARGVTITRKRLRKLLLEMEEWSERDDGSDSVQADSSGISTPNAIHIIIPSTSQ